MGQAIRGELVGHLRKIQFIGSWPISFADHAGLPAGPDLLFALVLPLFPGNGFSANFVCTCRTDTVTRRLATDIANSLATFRFR